MKIAAAQIRCALGDLDANLRTVRDFAALAKEAGAAVVVFPEMVDTGYAMPVIQAVASAWGEGAVPELQKVAKGLDITIVCGVSEREGSAIYNSQVVIDGSGKMLMKYRKTHLFAMAGIDEQKCFSAGSDLASFAIGNLRFGLSICYDLRFPEVYRSMAVNHEANVLLNSSAWPFPRVEHFRTLAVARAIENQSYMIAANRVGTDDGVVFCGTSAIIDPSGVVVASASADREELVCAELSEELLHSVRTRMTVFAHRRPDVYQSVAKPDQG